MAERRMFAKTIIDSDAFLEMPLSAQALYFHLSMRADDDGFLNNAKKIMRVINANQNDYDLLVAKSFIIQFEDGICVIKHWRINNYLRSDRYKPTIYKEEKKMLEIKENGRYSLINADNSNVGIPNSYQCETQYSIGKDSIDKNSIEKEKYKKEKPVFHKHGEYGHVLLSDEQYDRLIADYGEKALMDGIKRVDEYCQEHGKKYKDYNLTLRKWGITAKKENQTGVASIKI